MYIFIQFFLQMKEPIVKNKLTKQNIGEFIFFNLSTIFNRYQQKV